MTFIGRLLFLYLHSNNEGNLAKIKVTMTNEQRTNLEIAIQGISTSELRNEVKDYFLTEEQFNTYANNRINGASHSQCMAWLREDAHYDALDGEENSVALDNFFNGGVQSVEEALTVFKWIQGRYDLVGKDVQLKYDADKESLHRYIETFSK